MGEFRVKCYVSVEVYYTDDGRLIPLSVEWEDGRVFRIDRAEEPENRDAVYRLNAEAPALLASCVRRRGGAIIHISTDYVFGGVASEPYREGPAGVPARYAWSAAFGLAVRGWNQGWSIGVFQFVKSARWRIGEQAALDALNQVHSQTGQGGPVEWHKMGSGWSWSR